MCIETLTKNFEKRALLKPQKRIIIIVIVVWLVSIVLWFYDHLVELKLNKLLFVYIIVLNTMHLQH